MKQSIQEQFEEFHANHPEVYDKIMKSIRAVRAKGFSRYGIATLWEVMRYHFNMERTEEFKLNNNYKSRYVRLIEEQNPDLKGFFQTRELRAR